MREAVKLKLKLATAEYLSITSRNKTCVLYIVASQSEAARLAPIK